MATGVRRVTRDKFAALCGNNHELIKFFESIADDVGATLPELIETAQRTADDVRAANDSLSETLRRVQGVTADLDNRPSLAPAERAQINELTSDLYALREQFARLYIPEDLTGQLADVRETLAAVPRRVTLALPFVTPEQYGAVGDGVADDTAAWQDAVDSGLHVLGRGGATYLMTGGITLATLHQIVDGGGSTMEPVGSFDLVTIGTNLCMLRNLWIDAAAHTGWAINAPTAFQRFVIEDVTMTDGAKGVQLLDCFTSWLRRVAIVQYTSQPARIVSTTAGTLTNSIWLDDFQFHDCTTTSDVLYLETAGAVRVSGSSFQGNELCSSEIRITTGANGGSAMVVIERNYNETHSGAVGSSFIHVGDPASGTNPCEGVRILSNYIFTDKRPVTIGANVNDDIQIIGNTIQDNGLGGYAVVAPANFVPDIHGNTGSMPDFDRRYTPALTFGGAAVGMVAPTKLGRWQRNGNVMHTWWEIVLTTLGASTGNAAVSLIKASSALSLDGMAKVHATNVAAVGGGLSGVIATSGTTVDLFTSGATGQAPANHLNFTNTSTIFGSATYEV